MSLSTPSVAALVAERISISNSPSSASAPRSVVAQPVEQLPAEQPRPSWLDGFRRVTSSGEFIPEIDGFRFIAISAVIIRHVSVLTMFWLLANKEGMLQYGRHGVELFFVVSGFILSTPFAMHSIRGGKQVSLKRYFTRRVTRLEPPYLLSLLIYFLFKMHFQPGQASVWDLLCSCFYSTGIVQANLPRVSTVTWSLEVEIQFYLMMPMLATLYWINRRWLRRGCIMAIALACALLGPFDVSFTSNYYTNNIFTFLPFFLAGLMLADVYATEWRGAVPTVQKSGIGWGDGVWLVGWPLLLLVFIPDNLLTRLVAPALVFLLYFSLFYSVWARKLMRVKVLTIIGGMCYSIYLIHNLVMEACLRIIGRWLPHHANPAMLGLFLVSIVPILVICGGYYRLIEKPCMKPDWPQRLVKWVRSRRESLRSTPQAELALRGV